MALEPLQLYNQPRGTTDCHPHLGPKEMTIVFSPRGVDISVGAAVLSPKESPPLSKLLQSHGREAAKRCRLLCFSPPGSVQHTK